MARYIYIFFFKEPEDFSGFNVEIDEYEDQPKRATPRFRENVFGCIAGIPVGTHWASRLDCSHDGVHRLVLHVYSRDSSRNTSVVLTRLLS